MPKLDSITAGMLVPPVGSRAAVQGGSARRPVAELAPTGVLRVGVFTGNPVIGTRDQATGAVSGTTVALAEALAGHAGVPVAIRE